MAKPAILKIAVFRKRGLKFGCYFSLVSFRSFKSVSKMCFDKKRGTETIIL